MGATPFGYELARQFGLKIQPTRPALVPLVFDRLAQKQYCDWRSFGGSDCERRRSRVPRKNVDHAPRTERPGNPASFFLLGARKADQPGPCAGARGHVGSSRSENQERISVAIRISGNLSEAICRTLVELHEPEALTNADLAKFEQEIHFWTVTPVDTEGYEKAEVTAGGVDTDELSSKSMESRKVPGLFFIGEVVT